MKRILLLALLISFAVQAPVQAESKVLAMIFSPEYKAAVKKAGSAIATDVCAGAAEGLEIAKDLLSGAETALRMPFVAASRGLNGLGSGIGYVAKNYPLVGLAASLGLMTTSAVKCNEADRKFQRSKADAYAGLFFSSLLPTTLFFVASLDKYCSPVRA